MPARRWITRETRQDLATAFAMFAFSLAVLFLGIGCAPADYSDPRCVIGMGCFGSLLAAEPPPVLASVPWQGVAFTDHTVDRYVRIGNTAIVVLQRRYVPICMHLDWRLRRSMQPAEGTLIA